MGAIGDLVSLAALCGVGYVILTWNNGTGKAITDSITQFAAQTTGVGDNTKTKDTVKTIIEDLSNSELPPAGKTLVDVAVDAAANSHNPGGAVASATTNIITNTPGGTDAANEILTAGGYAANPIHSGEIVAAAAGKVGEGISKTIDSIANGTWEWTGIKGPWEWGQ